MRDYCLGKCMRQNRFLHILSLLIILTVSLLTFLGMQTRQAETMAMTPTFEADFTVYPDGWVSIDGLVNQTVYSYPYSPPQPTGYTTLEFGWDGSLGASVRSMYTLPNETVAEFPLNATTLSVHSKKVGDTLTSQVNATVVIPPVIEEWSPLSMTDLSLVSECEAGEINGNLTVIVAGYPASTIDFSGNATQLSFVGEATIPFVSFQGFEINRSVVEESLNFFVENFIGQGPYSLWNLTEGLAECPSELFSNVTTFYDNYASVSFEMQIQGNLTSLAGKLLVSSSYYPWGYPYAFPPEVEAMINRFLDSALDRVQRDVVQMTYTYSDRKLVFKESTTVIAAGFREYIDDIGDILTSIPDMPSGMDTLIDILLTETYASIESYEFSATYSLVGEFVKEGRITCALDVVFSGDLNEEINFIRAKAVSYYLATMPTGYPVPWQLEFINSTSVDIGSLKLSYNISTSSVLMGWQNLRVHPPREILNATHFRVSRVFNLTKPTYGLEVQGRITVSAGSNITHTVSIVRPSSVSVPDSVVEGEMMVWENQTLSSIEDLVFRIESVVEGSYSAGVIDNPGEVTEESPFIIDATNEANATLTITSISSPATIVVRNQTDVDVAEPSPGSLLLLGNYIEIVCEEGVAVNATIRIDYSPEDLAEAGLDENTLRIYYWDAGVEEWVGVETYLNAEEHYAWAVIDHFSTWGLFGQLITPFWMQWWFYAIVGVVVVVAMVLVFVSLRRRRSLTPEISGVTGETEE